MNTLEVKKMTAKTTVCAAVVVLAGVVGSAKAGDIFDAEVTTVSRTQTNVCGELWSPTTDLRGCYQIE